MKHTQETRKKLSEARKKYYAEGGKHPRQGVKLSEEIKAKIRKSNSGANNANWKGGRRPTSNGYVWVYAPDHPNKTSQNRVLEHRLVMEKHLGRYLLSHEVVHHINCVRNDNRISNLMLTTSSENVAISNSTRIYKESTKEKKIEITRKAKRSSNGRFI